MNRLCLMMSLLLLPMVVMTASCRKEDKNNPEDSAPVYQFRKDGELSVLDAQGEVKASFDIEIADTEETRQRGLKYRENMEDNQAMLFIFDGKDSYGFWMEDTYLPLDMLFIDYQDTIYYIEEHTQPFSRETIEPGGLNLYTLEVKAGICEKYKIKAGDKIKWEKTP